MLVPWFETPLFAELEAFRREVDALVSAPQTFDVPRGLSAGRGLHFHDDGEHYVVSADMPGVSLEDLDIEATGRQLVIRGKRMLEAPEGFTRSHRERSDWNFERTLALPEDVDADGIEASLRDGVLAIRVPRTAQLTPRRIAVTA